MFHNFPSRVEIRLSKLFRENMEFAVFLSLPEREKRTFFHILFNNTCFALVKVFSTNFFFSTSLRICSSAHEYTQFIVSSNHTIFIKQKQARRACVCVHTHCCCCFYGFQFSFQSLSSSSSLSLPVTDEIVYALELKSAYSIPFSSTC